LEDSILKSTKKILNIPPDYEAFDQDIITYINSTLVIVNQLGVGPSTAFSIEDSGAEWDDLNLTDNQVGLLKSYIGLKVRMLFDPPNTSFVIEALNNMIQEHEHRLVASAELKKLQDI
jgi:hypothetical protein